MNNTNNILGYIALISLFGVTGFVFGAILNTPMEQIKSQKASAASAIIKKPYDFSKTNVTAKSAYVFDIANNKIVFEKKSVAQLPLASITKVSVVLLAYEYLRPDGKITISASAIATEGDSGFTPGEKWKVRDLIDFTLMTSSNDGAVALSEAIEKATNTDIATLLNTQASRLGLTQTYFVNETGLDSNTLFSGSYGSAKDMGALFMYAYKTAQDIFTATTLPEYVFTNLDGKKYEAQNTNKAINELPGLVFGKTGFTDLAGGNLAIVIEPEPGHPFAIVVLGSTLDGRFSDVISLAHTLFNRQADKTQQ